MGAILLASGNSRRFGGNKLLHPVEGICMAERGLRLLNAADVSERIVVTQYEEVEEIARSLAISSIRNDHPEQGISHSIHLGMRALETMDSWMFLVCDQPWLQPESIGQLIKKYRESGCGIAALSCGQQIGNPVIFSAKYREELWKLSGDKGGKKILLTHLEDTMLVEVEKQELEDVDVR